MESDDIFVNTQVEWYTPIKHGVWVKLRSTDHVVLNLVGFYSSYFTIVCEIFALETAGEALIALLTGRIPIYNICVIPKR